jgi:hypothetical protein
VTLTLFRDGHSFTLYVPGSGVPVSLAGLEFRVNVSADEQLVRRLDTDYAAFLGLPFGDISSLGAVCLRLVQASSNEPVPQACQSGTLLIPQQLATADLFWLDTAARLERTVFVYQGNDLRGVCGPGDSCAVALPVGGAGATSTPVPTEAVRGYPCEGTVAFGTGGMLTNVYIIANPNSPRHSPVERGSKVTVLRETQDVGTTWYEIEYANDDGWVESRYIELGSNCPE